MKTLVCGDVHCKGKAMTDAIDQLFFDYGYDRIVFLGDYVDDWGASPRQMIQSTRSFLNWVANQRSRGIVVDLLCGNHDLAYLSGRMDICSGTRFSAMHDLASLLNKADIKLATTVDGYLCAHAGLTVRWADWVFPEAHEAVRNADEWADLLNEWFDRSSRSVVTKLASAGPARGGWCDPSVVWADANELLMDCEPDLPQIVGHTPVETVTHVGVEGRDLWFCDTWSNHTDGTPIGDHSFLLVEDGTFSVIGG